MFDDIGFLVLFCCFLFSKTEKKSINIFHNDWNVQKGEWKKESFVHINNDLHMNVKEKFDDDYYLIWSFWSDLYDCFFYIFYFRLCRCVVCEWVNEWSNVCDVLISNA